jgi:hypothetical protein
MSDKSHNGGTKTFTNDQLRGLAEMTIQHDAELETLRDLIYEIMLEAFSRGKLLQHEKEVKRAYQSRAASASLSAMQRDSYRKSLGLE